MEKRIINKSAKIIYQLIKYRKTICLIKSLFILLFFSTACKNSKKIDLENIFVLDIKKGNESIKLSTIADSLKIIKISNEKSIGSINKMLCFQDGYLIGDYKTKSIYFIDKKGSLIFSIDKKGKGPGEFSSLTCFSVDSINKHIYLYDSRQTKLLCYDQNGKFLTEKKLGLVIEDMAIDHLGNIYFYSTFNTNYYNKQEFPPGLYKYNIQANKINLLYEKKQNWEEPLVIPSSLDGYGSNIVFYPFHEEIIYSIKSTKLIPIIKIPYTKLCKTIYKEWGTTEVKCFQNYLFIRSSLGHNITPISILKGFSVTSGIRLDNDFFGLFLSSPVLIENNYILFTVPSSLLLEFKSMISSLLKNKDKNAEEFAKNLTLLSTVTQDIKEDDNPLILKFKLK